ncbi:MAG TPA: hypothetical protein DEG26_05620 [Chloroflexi bacterium]|jgi:hypothetical protein|nr:hypothetical protein [Chloroflexota bacterium]
MYHGAGSGPGAEGCASRRPRAAPYHGAVPWSWLTRFLLAALARRFVRSRPAGRPGPDVQAFRARVAAAREPASIVALLLVLVILACPTAALIAAGVTLLLLGPQWLGGAFVGVAVLLILAMVPEIVRLRRTLHARRLRLRGSAVTRELDSTRPV